MNLKLTPFFSDRDSMTPLTGPSPGYPRVESKSTVIRKNPESLKRVVKRRTSKSRGGKKERTQRVGLNAYRRASATCQSWTESWNVGVQRFRASIRAALLTVLLRLPLASIKPTPPDEH